MWLKIYKIIKKGDYQRLAQMPDTPEFKRGYMSAVETAFINGLIGINEAYQLNKNILGVHHADKTDRQWRQKYPELSGSLISN